MSAPFRQEEEPLLSIISRYIAASYVKLLLLCVSSFIAIYLTIDFLEKLGKFTRMQAAPQHIGLFFLYKIPEIADQVLPLAVLLATLLTLGTLSRNSEIIALRGCGLGLPSITAPILAISLAASILSLVAGELLLPKTYSRMKYVENVLIGKKNPNAFFRQDHIWFREGTDILQAKLFDPATQVLKGITIWQTTGDTRPVRRIEAAEGKFTGSHWLLQEVTIREVAAEAEVSTTTVRSMPVPLRLKVADLRVLEKYADSMGFFDLRRYCRKLEQGGYDATRYRAQMYSRISFPFASLIMSFLGIPFALKTGRSSGIAVGVGISLGIGFSYFILNAVILSFGQEGVIPPPIAAWAANALFTAAAVWLTLTVNR